MDTNREVIYNFRQFFQRDGFTSDDLGMTDQAVLNELLTSRAVIVRNNYNKGNFLPEQMFQTIPCVELQLADRNDCPVAPNSGCMWMKSKKPIPTTLITQTLSTRLGNLKATYTPWDKVANKLNSRIPANRKALYYTYKDTDANSYLYVYNTEELKLIQLTAIFLNPIDAAAFCGLNKEAVCNPLDLPFYTSDYLLDPIKKLSADTIVRLKSLNIRDQQNNDKLD